MTEDERPVIVLGSVDSMMSIHVAGSGMVIADCGHTCYISPTGQQHYDQGGMRSSCVECMNLTDGDIRTGIEKGEIRIPKGGYDELEQNFGRNAVEQMRLRLGIKESE